MKLGKPRQVCIECTKLLWSFAEAVKRDKPLDRFPAYIIAFKERTTGQKIRSKNVLIKADNQVKNLTDDPPEPKKTSKNKPAEIPPKPKPKPKPDRARWEEIKAKAAENPRPRNSVETFLDKNRKFAVDKAELKAETIKSQNSYAWFADPDNTGWDESVLVEHRKVDGILTAVPQWPPLVEGRVYRVEDWSHIPIREDAVRTQHISTWYAKDCNSVAWKQYTVHNGELVETGRSHWEGGLGNGWYSSTHGEITPRLFEIWCEAIRGLGNKGNFQGYDYLDDMKMAALEHLMQKGLRMNTMLDTSPFAWLTSVINHVFIAVIKKHADQLKLESEMRQDAGMDPTYWEQAELDYQAGLRQQGLQDIKGHIVAGDVDPILFDIARKKLVKQNKRRQPTTKAILEAMNDLSDLEKRNRRH